MAVLKCTICGGELEVNADLSVGVCKYCDSIITIPKELDRKGNLYNRAIFLRQSNQFDKAVATYEDILKEDNSDAEAHWGLVLSKYGIEYVLDPKTQERIPTCHRTRAESILSDPDYSAALEHADAESKKVFENEAERINKIQAKILQISQQEEPYDIFICYKETDEFGNRTEDSTLAQELYYELTKRNYRVFFAKKSLESKIGSEYEPIIYAALTSARVMIVLGTKPEHFNAVWVRNEWSRFIHMSKDADKTIIPAYRGMSPYELPAELSTLQSQDMSKIGFMQDLTDGIERCMRDEVHKKANKVEPAQTYETTQLERWLQNGATYLKLDNYDLAEEVYAKVTREYPEDHRGWWGVIVGKTKNFTDISCDKTKLNTIFEYVRRLCAPDDYLELRNQYVEYTEKASHFAAAKEIKSVKERIGKYNNMIEALKANRDSISGQIAARENDYGRLLENDNGSIDTLESVLKSGKRDLRSKKELKIVGGGLVLFGIILFIKVSITSGMMLILIGAAIFGSAGFVKEAKFAVEDARVDVLKGYDDRDKHKKEFETDVEKMRREITDLEGRISGLEGKIADCRRYIDVGEDKIAEFLFAKECNALGVSKSFDSHIQAMRELAFEERAEE